MFDFRKLSLEKKVQYFIKQRKETEFWDFKQKQPDNISDLTLDERKSRTTSAWQRSICFI